MTANIVVMSINYTPNQTQTKVKTLTIWLPSSYYHSTHFLHAKYKTKQTKRIPNTKTNIKESSKCLVAVILCSAIVWWWLSCRSQESLYKKRAFLCDSLPHWIWPVEPKYIIWLWRRHNTPASKQFVVCKPNRVLWTNVDFPWKFKKNLRFLPTKSLTLTRSIWLTERLRECACLFVFCIRCVKMCLFFSFCLNKGWMVLGVLACEKEMEKCYYTIGQWPARKIAVVWPFVILSVVDTDFKTAV